MPSASLWHLSGYSPGDRPRTVLPQVPMLSVQDIQTWPAGLCSGMLRPCSPSLLLCWISPAKSVQEMLQFPVSVSFCENWFSNPFSQRSVRHQLPSFRLVHSVAKDFRTLTIPFSFAKWRHSKKKKKPPTCGTRGIRFPFLVSSTETQWQNAIL